MCGCERLHKGREMCVWVGKGQERVLKCVGKCG